MILEKLFVSYVSWIIILLNFTYASIDLNLLAGSSMVTIKPKTHARVEYEQNLSKEDDIITRTTNKYYRFRTTLNRMKDSFIDRLVSMYKPEMKLEILPEGTYKCENGDCEQIDVNARKHNRLKPSNELTRKAKTLSFLEPPEPLSNLQYLDLDRIREAKQNQAKLYQQQKEKQLKRKLTRFMNT